MSGNSSLATGYQQDDAFNNSSVTTRSYKFSAFPPQQLLSLASQVTTKPSMPKKNHHKNRMSGSYADVAAPHDIPSPPHSSFEDDKSQMQHQGYDLVGRAISRYPPNKPYCTGIEETPVTFDRTPYIPSDNSPLMDAGTARATIAASKESPNGTQDGDWTREHQHMTVVQQHVAYWDQDGDGIIWPHHTYLGCRAWGWSIPLSLLVAYIINGALSYPTVPGLLPDPFFRIYIDRLHKDKHGSDSMSFDNEGRFRPQNFEDLFAKYDRGNKGGLDKWDLWRAWNGQRMVFDFFGSTAALLEWFATYLLLWPEDGILRKEEVRRVFDGSIFQHKADQYAEKQRRANKGRRSQTGWLQSLLSNVLSTIKEKAP